MQLPLPDHRSFDRFRLLRKRWRGEMDAPPWCRQCGYSMQALMKPVCPECGSDLRAVGVLGARVAPFRWSFVVTPIFVVVAMFVSLMVHHDHSYYQINRLPGLYKERMWGNVWNVPDAGAATSWGTIQIAVDWDPQWRMSRHPLPPHPTILATVGHDDGEKIYVLDLSNRTYRSETESGPFNDKTLQSWLSIAPPITEHDVQVTRTMMDFLESIGNGTLTLSGHHGKTIDLAQATGSGSFHLNYFYFSYNSSSSFYNIAYWLLVLLVVVLVSRLILRMDRPRRARK